jgi:hypothetical protein
VPCRPIDCNRSGREFVACCGSIYPAHRARAGHAPHSDELRLFDGQRKVVVTMAENLERATPVQRREFVLPLVERAIAHDKAVEELRWVAPARPFFGEETSRLGKAL